MTTATRRELRDLLTAAYETAYCLPKSADADLLLDLLESAFDALGMDPDLDAEAVAALYALDPCRERGTGRRRLVEEPDVCPDGDEIPF